MTCPACGHLLVEHSSEPGVGCLHITYRPLATLADVGYTGGLCPCTTPGTSQADQ